MVWLAVELGSGADSMAQASEPGTCDDVDWGRAGQPRHSLPVPLLLVIKRADCNDSSEEPSLGSSSVKWVDRSR